MRTFKFILFLALLLFIENIWQLPYKPDLFLIFAVTFCLQNKVSSGLAFSFSIGFVEDVLFSAYFFNTLIKTVIAALISFIKEKLILNLPKLSLILIGFFSPLSIILKAVLNSALAGEPIVWSSFFIFIVISTVLNLIFTPLFLHFYAE